MFDNIKVMNQKILLLIPLVLVLVFFLYKNKNVLENFRDGVTYPMSGAERNDFNKCRKIRKALYDPKGGTILYQDLINPTAADNPIAPEQPQPDTEIPRRMAFENYKRNCAGGNSSIDNFLMRDYHYNHFGAIRTKKIVNNAVKNRPAWSKNPNNHRYSVPVDMIERVDSKNPKIVIIILWEM